MPEAQIAREPAERREAARLLVLGPGEALAHRVFSDLPSLLRPGDVLVVNETQVVRARLHATRTGGALIRIV